MNQSSPLIVRVGAARGDDGAVHRNSWYYRRKLNVARFEITDESTSYPLHLIFVLLTWMRRYPFERLLNKRRYLRRGRQMSTLRLETSFVRDVRQRNLLAVVARITVTTLRVHRLVLLAGVLQVALFLRLDPVPGLVAPFVRAVRIWTLLTLADDWYHLLCRSSCHAACQRDHGYLNVKTIEIRAFSDCPIFVVRLKMNVGWYNVPYLYANILLLFYYIFLILFDYTRNYKYFIFNRTTGNR